MQLNHPDHPMPSREFTVLMASLMSIVAISIDALLPALGMIASELQLTNPNRAQLVITCLFIGSATGQLISGPMSDALGRKPVLYAGLALYLLGSLVCYFSLSFPMLLAGRILQGLGVSGPYVTAISVVRDKYAGRAMAQAMSLIMMIFILVPAMAPSMGQAILGFAHWRSIFLLYIGYALAVGLWIAMRLEETLPRVRRVPFTVHAMRHGFLEVIRNRTTVCYMLCMGICFGSLIGYLNSSQQIFQQQFGAGEQFALYFGGLALMIGMGSLLNSRLVQRVGMRPICLHATVTIIAASATFLLLHVCVAITLPLFVGYAAILFFCFGLMFGNLNAIAMEPMGHIAGMASALTGSISSIISVTLGTTIGQLYNGTLIPVAAGFTLLGTLSFVIMRYANAAPPDPASSTTAALR